jgi:hypothetical protein
MTMSEVLLNTNPDIFQKAFYKSTTKKLLIKEELSNITTNLLFIVSYPNGIK